LFREFLIKVEIFFSIFQTHLKDYTRRFGHGGRLQSTYDTWSKALDFYFARFPEADEDTKERLLLGLNMKQSFHLEIRVPVNASNWTLSTHSDAMIGLAGPLQMIADLVSTTNDLLRIEDLFKENAELAKKFPELKYAYIFKDCAYTQLREVT